MKTAPRIIISGGGTGGHIFPAIAIARELQAMRPDAEILFVGAEGRMEMEKVPQAGYRIIGLPIAGIQRRLTWKNLLVPFKVLKSLWKARTIIREFRPDIAIGVGGYASGPLLRSAASMGVPTVVQEQNSYPGITNKILARGARKICVAYEGMEKFFPAEKLVLTGNPVRPEIRDITIDRSEACKHFGLDPQKKVVLVIGGSLGARTINLAMAAGISAIRDRAQLIWQTGKSFAPRNHEFESPGICVREFIREMDMAYAAADIIVSRAGAMSISELCVVGKPAILVPSPNVAEDHQTHNAMSLTTRSAAVLVRDAEAGEKLMPAILQLLDDPGKMAALSGSIASMARPGAGHQIATEVMSLIESASA